MQKLHKIYQSFLLSPYLNACLVLDHQQFLGILLKKDLERKLRDQHNTIVDLIIKVPLEELEDILFNIAPSLKMTIPYINIKGTILGSLLYEEFVSEFFPHDFKMRLSFQEIFDYHEHPIMILNQFKTILYINKIAENLFSSAAFGKKITDILLAFEIVPKKDRILLVRQEEVWDLVITKSSAPHASYYLYHLFPYSNQ